MQNNGKEMYKCVLHVQSCFLLTGVSTDFFAVLVPLAVPIFFCFEYNLSILTRASLLALAKFIYYFVVLHNNSIFLN